MTDHVNGFVVTLSKDMREDDAEQIKAALLMVKGVLEVEPVIADTTRDQMIRAKCNAEWRDRLYAVLKM